MYSTIILYKEREIFVHGSFPWRQFCGGKISPPLEIPKAPNCLMHTFTCKPMPCSETERFANQMATKSSFSSEHMKESAVPNTCPNYRPTGCSAIGILTALPTPLNVAMGNFATFLKHENFP